MELGDWFFNLVQDLVVSGAEWVINNPELAAALVIGVIIGRSV